MKKITLVLLSTIYLLSTPTVSFADAIVGDSIVTLGENLSDDQKKNILNEMGVPQDQKYITVTNAEEYQYLGKYIPKSQIGTRAISSSKITIGEKDSGIVVKTKNISWVTEDMYKNALITAGVKDTEVYVTAPFEVSGTAALTGIIKAYEQTTDVTIPEEQKQVANEEMVKSAQLGDSIGDDKANALMSSIKEKIAKEKPQTKEEVQNVVEDAAKEANVTLTQEQLNGLVSLFNKMKDLNIDWNAVGEQAKQMKEKFNNFIHSDEAQSFFEKVKDFFAKIIEIISSWFK